MSSSKMTTVLWCDRGEGRKAAEFYASTFPNSRMGSGMDSPVDNPSTPAGEEITVDFTLCGQPFMALNGGPNFKPNESVSFMILTDDQEETDRLWNAVVGNGGQESMCGWCKDRWGYSWQITPRRLMELNAEGGERGKRAFQAMMGMKKIDIAALEAAAEGAPADA